MKYKVILITLIYSLFCHCSDIKNIEKDSLKLADLSCKEFNLMNPRVFFSDPSHDAKMKIIEQDLIKTEEEIKSFNEELAEKYTLEELNIISENVRVSFEECRSEWKKKNNSN